MIKKRKAIFLLLVLSPFIIVIVVNSTMNKPTDLLLENQCSRYCHNNGCPHVESKLEKHATQYPMLSRLKGIYDMNIALLHQNGMGMSYQQANLFIYVLLLPSLMVLLLWGALRKRKYE